jgi:heat shock protein HslJ
MKTPLLMITLLFAILFSSCENSIETKFTDFEQIKSKYWQLISYKSESGDILSLEDIDDVLYKNFVLNFYHDSICYGTSGCNSYSGNYLVSSNEISFSNFTSTEVFCNLWEQPPLGNTIMIF